MKIKAVILFSGGLDSILAAKLIASQDIELEAIHFYTVFLHDPFDQVRQRLKAHADMIGIPLNIVDMTGEHLALVKKPLSGYGANINPCIDCKLLMFQKAKIYMEQEKASFLVSGEVLGQRAMSQRLDVFRRIERIAGLKKMIVRPLSARRLELTIAEEKKWIDRDKLYAIQSRSRKVQMRLAREIGIEDYPQPGGGCLLTDPGYSRRFKDLFSHFPECERRDIAWLRYGRHFRVSARAKLIVPRNADEAESLDRLIDEKTIHFLPASFDGYGSYGIGEFTDAAMTTAVNIAAYYYPRFAKKTVMVKDGVFQKEITASSLSPALVKKYLV